MNMDISCVMCTRNRANKLRACLDVLSHAMLHAKDHVKVEAVIVNNGSTDDTEQVIRDWQETNSELHIHYVLEHKRGLSAARNAGIRNARGDVIAMTDDDCFVQEDYFMRIHHHFADNTAPLLRGGRVLLGDPKDMPITVQYATEAFTWHKDSSKWVALNGGVVPGCNLMIARGIIEAIGVFDEAMGAGQTIPAGEDSDFIYRAYNAGFKIEYVPDVVVSHYHGRREKEQMEKLKRSYSIGTGALIAKHRLRHPNIQRRFDKSTVYYQLKKDETGITDHYKVTYSTIHKCIYYSKGVLLYSIARLQNLCKPYRKNDKAF